MDKDNFIVFGNWNSSNNITESEKIHKLLDSLGSSYLDTPDDDIIGKNNLLARFKKYFEKLYVQCVADNYFWQFCTANVYKETFTGRKAKYLNNYQDATDLDFINGEIADNDYCYRKIKGYGRGKGVSLVYYFIHHGDLVAMEINERVSLDIIRKILFSRKRKIDFLSELSESTDNIKENDDIKDVQIPLDYSNNSDAEKIVFLHEIGVLDFLRQKQPFNMSTNKLAEVVSSFTGINQTTAQSYLNPIFSKGVDKSKSPLSAKNLKSVSEKLMKMGYNK